MDKVKQYLFTIVILVLLVAEGGAFYFLVFQKWGAIEDKRVKLRGRIKALDLKNRQEENLTNEPWLRYLEMKRKRLRGEYWELFAFLKDKNDHLKRHYNPDQGNSLLKQELFTNSYRAWLKKMAFEKEFDQKAQFVDHQGGVPKNLGVDADKRDKDFNDLSVGEGLDEVKNNQRASLTEAPRHVRKCQNAEIRALSSIGALFRVQSQRPSEFV